MLTRLLLTGMTGHDQRNLCLDLRAFMLSKPLSAFQFEPARFVGATDQETLSFNFRFWSDACVHLESTWTAQHIASCQMMPTMFWLPHYAVTTDKNLEESRQNSNSTTKVPQPNSSCLCKLLLDSAKYFFGQTFLLKLLKQRGKEFERVALLCTMPSSLFFFFRSFGQSIASQYSHGPKSINPYGLYKHVTP